MERIRLDDPMLREQFHMSVSALTTSRQRCNPECLPEGLAESEVREYLLSAFESYAQARFLSAFIRGKMEKHYGLRSICFIENDVIVGERING